MKHIRKIMMVAVCLMFTATTLVSAVSYQTTVPLYEKDPVTWQIVPGGARGQFMFGVESLKYLGTPMFIKSFVVIANGLNPNTAYTMVCYPSENWPYAQYLGTGTSTSTGYLQIRGMYLVTPTYKAWLVLASDFDNTNKVFIGWHPSEYLFEENIF